MNRYRITSGPVHPPMSLYGPGRVLQTGDTFESAENPWIRGCMRDGRMTLEPTKAKRKRKSKAEGGRDAD